MKKFELERGVAIVGAGMSNFGAFMDKNSRDLFVEAYLSMVESIDNGLDPNRIEMMYVGNFSSDQFEKQAHIAPIMADAVGLVPIPTTRVENACASGGAALRQGVMAIASGMADVVLVGGVERMNSLPTSEVTDVLATAGDALYEISIGQTFPGFYAAMASAYMHQYDMKPEHLMHVAHKNHENGALNPQAQFGITIADWMAKRKKSAEKKGKPIPTWESEMDFFHDDQANPMIASPLRLFDCSPITDGAAAVLLVADEFAAEFTESPIHIVASAQASDYPLHDRKEITSIGATRIAAQKAYAMAGIKPEQVRIAEVHDCFTIAEVIATEDLDFFPQGEGFGAAEDGVTSRNGSRPINTSGGLKSKGHPVGATGVAQAVEIFRQMRKTAGERNVQGDVEIALSQNVGGTGSTSVIHIYERRR